MEKIAEVNRPSPITLGDRLRCREVEGFVFTETAHAPNQTLTRHYHERANIAFVLSGSFSEVVGKQTFDCMSQSLIIKPAGEAHANHYGRVGMRGFLIELKPKTLASLNSVGTTLCNVNHVRSLTSSLLATRIYRELHMMDVASRLALEGLSLELIAELSRSVQVRERRPPQWLERAREVLHENWGDTVSLNQVACCVDVHPVHLAREFRRFYGCTLGEYVRRLRIQFACRQLSTSDVPLVVIALNAGFSHQAHFSRLFKRYTGMTPSAYRSLYRIPR
jgi:AraC family transcriptional regulator